MNTISVDAYRDLTDMEREAMNDIAETLPLEVESWFWFREKLRQRIGLMRLARSEGEHTVARLLLTQVWSTYYRFTRESEELLTKI